MIKEEDGSVIKAGVNALADLLVGAVKHSVPGGVRKQPAGRNGG